MSLTASMWTGVSGLLAHGEKMNVIGNNIANVSTVGFKGQRMDFADFVYQNKFTNSGIGQIGRGTKIGAVMQNFETGAFESSTEATDLAISGRGFFKVNKTGSDQAFYTRAGNFRFNNEGYLNDPNGLTLQGWRVDNKGGVIQAAGGMNPDSVTNQSKSDIIGSGVPTDIKLDTYTVFPQQTTKVTFKVNLPKPGEDKIRNESNPFASMINAWDGSQPPASPTTPPISSQSYAHQTTMEVFDEAGTKHKVTIYYDKVSSADYDGGANGTDIWEYMVTMDPAEDMRQFAVTDPVTGAITMRNVNETTMGGMLMSGTMTFNSSGNLVNQTAYTWGGSQDDISNPNSFSNVPDPADPLQTKKVINLDPSNLNNWQPAAISSNGYPMMVANFTGIMDAQTPGSPGGSKYNIEMDFGLKVGNFSMPWENNNSLGSLAVLPYAANDAYKVGNVASGPKYLELNPGYNSNKPWNDANSYKYKFNGLGYDANGCTDAAGSAPVLAAIHQLYGDITFPVGALGTSPEPSPSTGVMQLPPAAITMDYGVNPPVCTSTKFVAPPALTADQLCFNKAIDDLNNLGVSGAQGTLGKSINDVIGEHIKSGTMTAKNRSVFKSAVAANANDLAEINKPVVIDAQACTNVGTSFSSNQAQNGYGYGNLSSWYVDADGVLYGNYSNGVQLPLWQITMYDFNCSQGLRREGNNLFSKTRESGESKSGPAGVSGLGTINGYQLEQSNVDMSTEFVQMITTQRGFQSNSKIITTTDTMLDTVINMKR